jgi:hypothetical protein
MHSLVHGTFYPFEFPTARVGFDYDEVAKRLELNALQKQLLWLFLCQINIQVWFEEENMISQLRLNVFWESEPVADVGLARLLGDLFESDGQIDDEKEITALEKLKTIIDHGIELREQRRRNDELIGAG